jgi:hypothetical protein
MLTSLRTVLGFVAAAVVASSAAAQPAAEPTGPAETPVQPAATAPSNAGAMGPTSAGVDLERPPQGTSTTTFTYGSHVAIADGISVGSLLIGSVLGVICFSATFELFSDNKPDDHPTCPLAVLTLGGGVLGYVAASPIIHGVHGNLPGALAALGLRLGAPVAAYGLMAAAGAEDSAGLPIVAAIVGAMIVDWALLARVERPVEAPRRASLRPVPLLSRRAAGLGVAGSF